ncbi:hypothetical protein Y032_0002g588 [Ancylostoma ceylanicum]|uniref:G-protein coupled receptors family 1 profile domain-containing protein n=1 Tax=Ancylostoma ceylanicum TaxID=53326 RepID=A0A016W0J4_9BILA|nr:hypothetical protein Y032_0002g588 [Ancylostoma ceylanicum]
MTVCIIVRGKGRSQATLIGALGLSWNFLPKHWIGYGGGSTMQANITVEECQPPHGDEPYEPRNHYSCTAGNETGSFALPFSNPGKRQRFFTFMYVDEDLEIRFALYTGFGIPVCISSTISILVFSSKDFRKKYIMFFALSFGDLINGLSFVAAGVFRNLFMFQGHYFIKVSDMECLFQTPWAILMIFAGQFPALINLCIAMERVVALEYAGWYRRVWRNRHKIYLVMLSVILTIVFFLLAVLFNIFRDTVSSSRICAVMNSTGILYGTVHYAVIALIYVLCFIVLAVIFNKTNRSRTPTKDEVRRQRMMLTITGISVILVSIPNLVLILNEWKAPSINALVVGIAYCLYATHSALSLGIYIAFRPDFRFRLFSMFGLHRISSVVGEPSRVQLNTIKSAVSNHMSAVE